jgi:uncharacterized Tic20 family protein
MSDFGQGGGGFGPPSGGGFGPPPGGGGFGPPQGGGGFGPPPGGGYGPPPGGGHGPPPAPLSLFRPGVGWFEQARAGGYQPSAQEMEHAFYAHLFAAIGAFLFCGTVFGAVAPLLVLAMAKDKGPFLLFHVNQAAIFQGVFFVINTAIGIVGGVLSIVCIGYFILLLWPFTWLIATIYPLVLAFGAKGGTWVEYPIVGQKVRTEWKPLFT